MIKCEIENHGDVTMDVTGSMKDITAEVLMLIQQIYESVKVGNPIAAEEFKLNIIRVIGMPDGPVWKDYSLDKPEKT